MHKNEVHMKKGFLLAGIGCIDVAIFLFATLHQFGVFLGAHIDLPHCYVD